MSSYIIIDGVKYLQMLDGSRAPVTAPLSLEGGTAFKLIPAQETILNQIKTEVESVTQLLGGDFAKLQNAGDLQQTFTYLDAGSADQRINTITYSSTSLGLTLQETYAYSGSAGNYVLTSITRALVA